MSSYFQQSGDAFSPTAGRDTLLDTLPTGNYVVAQSMSGLFYQRVAPFSAPGKMYGNIEKHADRVINTFLSRPRSTGVLFAGEKGSGKSQLARLISHKGYARDIPTIVINAPWHGDQFASLLQDVEQPAIVLMDEFEKVYDNNQQEAVLTLLDGTMTSKKLFILTVNDKYRVNDHMRNRPGRLFYALDFDGLESAFVREYCTDNLDASLQEHVETVVRISTIFEKFNFDILKALIEEMNRYNEDPYDALEWLNAKPVPEYSSTQYAVQAWDPEGNEVVVNGGRKETYEVTPLNAHGGAIGLMVPDPDVKGDDEFEIEFTHIIVKGADAKKVDTERGMFEFLNEDGYRVVFTKQATKSYDLRQMSY